MSNYSTLKAAISAVIKENNNHEITGQVLQTTLLAMVDSLAGGYLFKGIATPATVVGTPDENVFYIGGGGVYSNFGATPVHVPDGCIGIFTYNGSFENHIIPTGGVFDISAYNAVGGTPATYADLTAALGTNGANIPDYLRKGGMSVKFIQGTVQSSDNNYVKFFCTADEFTTDVAYWQNMNKLVLISNLSVVLSSVSAGTLITECFSLLRNHRYKITLDTTGSVGNIAASLKEGNSTISLLTDGQSANTIYTYNYTSDKDYVQAYANVYFASASGKATVTIKDVTLELDTIPVAGSKKMVESSGIEKYLAHNVEELAIPYTISSFEQGNIAGATGEDISGDSIIREKIYTQVASNPSFSYSIASGYRFRVSYYKGNTYVGITEYPGFDGTGTFTINSDIDRIRLTIKTIDGTNITPSDFTNTQLELTCNKLSVLKPAIPKEQIEKIDTFGLISGADCPQFDITGLDLQVSFPTDKIIRLYKYEKGALLDISLSSYNTPFSILNTQRLVYDLDDNTIKVVGASSDGHYLILLAVVGAVQLDGTGYVYGALSGYYNAYIKNVILGRIPGDVKDIRNLYSKQITPILNNLVADADLKLFFFSDVHARQENVKRIIQLANKFHADSDLSCIINGGDTVSGVISEGLAWYNLLVDACHVPVLNVPGNHDCWTSGWVWASQTDVYNLITAKVAATANIVQPDNAASLGLNYYYKDFGNIRIVCICSMYDPYAQTDHYFDSAQKQWFENVLEDTKSHLRYYKINQNLTASAYELQEGDEVTATIANISMINNMTLQAGQIYAVPMSVIVVNHAPFSGATAVRKDEKYCSTLDFRKVMISSKGIAWDEVHLNQGAVNVVKDFIDTGGSFICWLTGHKHTDNVLVNSGDDAQFMFNIVSAGYNNRFGYYAPANIEDKNYDAFSYIGIDLRGGYIKMYRIGQNQDKEMKTIPYWCYDYVNKKFLY